MKVEAAVIITPKEVLACVASIHLTEDPRLRAAKAGNLFTFVMRAIADGAEHPALLAAIALGVHDPESRGH